MSEQSQVYCEQAGPEESVCGFAKGHLSMHFSPRTGVVWSAMGDRQFRVREVTREAWKALPLERSYYRLDEDDTPHFFEILREGNDRG